MRRVYIGTSGYSYKGWDKTFYGDDVPKSRQLEYYAEHFPTVEINATFYRLPSEGMVRGWAERVCDEFLYAVKGSRFITHMKKLVNLDGAMDKFFDRIEPMEERTAVILWQLPPMLRRDLGRLEDFLATLPRAYEHAVEFRHLSWYDDDGVFEVLRRERVAHVHLSSRGMPFNRVVTSNVVYIRFHGLEGGAAHDYTTEELEPWAEFINEQAEAGRTVFAYFNNDINTRAPENGIQLMEMVGDWAVKPSPKIHRLSTPYIHQGSLVGRRSYRATKAGRAVPSSR